MEEKELIEKAIEASKKAYAPYSKFQVGASLLAKDGTCFTGCNVENASFSLTNCAERTALFSAVAKGYNQDFTKLVVYVDREDFTAPCGACRQVIHELAPEVEICLVNNQGRVKRLSVGDLLPFSFGSEDLK